MKFQNPSLNSVLNEWKDGRKDERTHKPKPICSPPIDLLIILYQLTKFEAPSCNTFRDIMIIIFKVQICKGR